MEIRFSAYAADCTVSGELSIEGDRLADFLTSAVEFEVRNASFRALEDGRVVDAASAQLYVDDLCLIVASGPRGRVERKLWTRQYPVRVRVGPYAVLGYLHAPPTIDPFHLADRRAIVALTACTVEYVEGGTTVRIESDAILLNTNKIDRIETASEHDLLLAENGPNRRGTDPGAKDLTAN